MKKKLFTFLLLAAMTVQCAAFAGSFSREAEEGNANKISYGAEQYAHTGAPDVPREAKHYGAADKIFLGTWECTNDTNSRLTIQEADPQTGGYHADFFFYRIANADAYANININGKQLDINQGTVNDNYDFRGIFTQIPGGIRFTLTESAFTYLKPGQVFEYKRMQGPKIKDSDILGLWSKRSWVDSKIVGYEFMKGNQWIAYGPNYNPSQNTKYSGMAPVAAGHYQVQHEGNYNPVFKLFEANGNFHAYIAIENDSNAGVRGLTINGMGPDFYKD